MRQARAYNPRSGRRHATRPPPPRGTIAAMSAELASAPTDDLEAGRAPSRGRWGSLLPGLLLALAVLVLLAPFAHADPPARLTGSNAPFTDEGFNLANARNRTLFGRFATDDVDRSLSNGAYSAVAAAVFRVTGARLAAGRAISMASLAAAVLLLAVGLAEPFGRGLALRDRPGARARPPGARRAAGGGPAHRRLRGWLRGQATAVAGARGPRRPAAGRGRLGQGDRAAPWAGAARRPAAPGAGRKGPGAPERRAMGTPGGPRRRPRLVRAGGPAQPRAAPDRAAHLAGGPLPRLPRGARRPPRRLPGPLRPGRWPIPAVARRRRPRPGRRCRTLGGARRPPPRGAAAGRRLGPRPVGGDRGGGLRPQPLRRPRPASARRPCRLRPRRPRRARRRPQPGAGPASRLAPRGGCPGRRGGLGRRRGGGQGSRPAAAPSAVAGRRGGRCARRGRGRAGGWPFPGGCGPGGRAAGARRARARRPAA